MWVPCVQGWLVHQGQVVGWEVKKEVSLHHHCLIATGDADFCFRKMVLMCYRWIGTL